MLTWLDRFFARGAYLPTTGDAPDIDSPPSWQPTITQLLANQLPDDIATHPRVAILAIGKRLSIYASLYICPIRTGCGMSLQAAASSAPSAAASFVGATHWSPPITPLLAALS